MDRLPAELSSNARRDRSRLRPLSARLLAIWLGLLPALGSAASPSLAQEAPAAGEDLLEQAIRLREQRRDVEALPLFRRAYEMWPSPRTEAQLGLGHQAVGQWAEAYRHLAAALAQRGDPWIASHREPLEQALSFVASQVGLVVLTGGVAGTEVRIGATVVGTLPLRGPVAVMPGSVVLELRAPGGTATRGVVVRAGERVTVTVDSEPAPPPGVVPTPARARVVTPPPRRARRVRGTPVWAWVAAGGAVALAGGAGVAWWRAHDAYDELESSSCGRARSCTDAQIDASGGPAAVTWTNLLLVGSGLAAAGAIVLFVVEARPHRDDDESRPRARIGVGPSAVVVLGSF